MKKAIIIWEKTLEDARAKYGDETVPADYPISDYIFEVLNERLTSSLSTSKEIINALIDYFNKSELIENGCFTLSSLSLAGRKYSLIYFYQIFLFRIWFI